ncbi:MAG: TolC family protein, partial [bacterium]
MKKTIAASLSALFLLPLLAWGHSALTWDQALKEAAQNNRDLRAAQQTVKAEEDSHQAALGEFFPQISLSASFDRSGSGGFNDA